MIGLGRIGKAIAGAALDFLNEPQAPGEPFSLDNVLLLPQIESRTRETFAAMEALVLDKLRCFFQAGRLLAPVS